MVTKTDISLCTGCGVCSAVCPCHCITIKADRYGFSYPDIDAAACINCGKCDLFCHAQNIKSITADDPTAYIAYNKDEEKRLNSSSGGIFVLLAGEALNSGGAVYGAAFDDNWAVSHVRIEEQKDLYKLQGSKYVQSAIGEEIYKSVYTDLENNKFVLYSETPCQIGALRRFLKKDYDKLLTVSFICHGVPSPALWKQYVEEQKEHYSSDISRISHRNKKNGWVNFSMMLRFLNKAEYCVSLKKDPYLQLFLKNTCLRDSCYNCQYKGKDYLSSADILLADKWGTVSGSLPDMDDDKGISTVFLQTPKGENIYNRIKDGLYYDETSYKEVIASNSSYNTSSKASIHRKEVLDELGKTSVDQIYRRYAKTPLKTSVKDGVVSFAYKAAKLCGIVWLVRKARKVRNGK